ncbi:MAG: Chromosome partition protein Smc [Chlamydiia bacterium]|nr:Chromosome partition protein Smc [Chlamydiia bacterium]MCH9614944.1 Chromosome partition protein Smc [Chlamydiia bacterium]MCH9630005.1 Chromosome partition protein Smc [Chlamydiia bacterium]
MAAPMGPDTVKNIWYTNTAGQAHDMGTLPKQNPHHRDLLRLPGFEKALSEMGIDPTAPYHVSLRRGDIRITMDGTTHSVKSALGETSEFYTLMSTVCTVFGLTKEAATGSTQDPAAARIRTLERALEAEQHAHLTFKATHGRETAGLRDTIATHVTTLGTAKRTCDSLKEQVAKLMAAHSEEVTNRRTLESQVQERDLQLQESTAAIKATQTTLDALTHRIAQLEPEAQQVPELQRKVNHLTGQLATLERRHQLDEAALQEGHAELSAQVERIHALEADLAGARVDISSLRVQRAADAIEIADLHSAMGTQGEAFHASERRNEALADAFSKTHRALRTSRAEERRLQAQLKSKEGDLATSHRTADTLRGELGPSRFELASLRKDHDALQARALDARTRAELATRRLALSERQVERLTTTNTDLRAQLEEQESTVIRLTEDLAAARTTAEVQTRKAELAVEQVRATATEYAGKISTVKAELSEALALLTETREAATASGQAMRALRSEHTIGRQAADEQIKAQTRIHERKVAKLEAELQTLIPALERADAEAHTLQTQIATMRRGNDEYVQALERKLTEAKSEQQELKALTAELREAQQTARTHEHTIQTMASRLAKSELSAIALRNLLTSTREELATAEAVVATRVQSLQTQFEAELEALQIAHDAQTDIHEGHKAELHRTIEGLTADFERRLEEASQPDPTISLLRTNIQIQEEEITSLRLSMDSQARQLADVQQQFARANETIREQLRDIVALSAANDRLSRNVERLQAYKTGVRSLAGPRQATSPAARSEMIELPGVAGTHSPEAVKQALNEALAVLEAEQQAYLDNFQTVPQELLGLIALATTYTDGTAGVFDSTIALNIIRRAGMFQMLAQATTTTSTAGMEAILASPTLPRSLPPGLATVLPTFLRSLRPPSWLTSTAAPTPKNNFWNAVMQPLRDAMEEAERTEPTAARGVAALETRRSTRSRLGDLVGAAGAVVILRMLLGPTGQRSLEFG